jgi:hypothetical protein
MESENWWMKQFIDPDLSKQINSSVNIRSAETLLYVQNAWLHFMPFYLILLWIFIKFVVDIWASSFFSGGGWEAKRKFAYKLALKFFFKFA